MEVLKNLEEVLPIAPKMLVESYLTITSSTNSQPRRGERCALICRVRVLSGLSKV